MDVQQVRVDNSPHYLLTGRRSGAVDSDIEIWLDPQKDYRPTRVQVHNRSILGVAPDEAPGEPPKPIPLETEYTLTRYTYHLEKFAPDIWFPKSVTREVSFSTTDEGQRPPPTSEKQSCRCIAPNLIFPLRKKIWVGFQIWQNRETSRHLGNNGYIKKLKTEN